MQRIREDRTEKENIGLAEAIGRTLILRLNFSKIFPKYCGSEDHVIMYFEDEIIDYRVEIFEDGHCVLTLTKSDYFDTHLDLEISDSRCIYNPLYNPDRIINKITKAAAFIRSLKDHMASANLHWIADGVKSVMDGSKDICTYQTYPNPFPIQRSIPPWLRKTLSGIPTMGKPAV